MSQIGTTILNAILVVLLIKFGSNIQVVKLGSAFVFVLRPILQNIYVRKKYNINFKNVKEKYDEILGDMIELPKEKREEK